MIVGGRLDFTKVVGDSHDDISHAARTIIEAIGEDPTREGLRETPRRVASAIQELTYGYHDVPRFTTFDAEGADQMICQWNIPMYSLCEHHMLPFAGYAHIGYIPRELIIGLSKFKRLVDVFARRLQVQERLTRQIATALEDLISPRGVIVVIEAEHFCMTMRGVQAPGTLTTTSAVTGDFLDPREGSREEFMSLLNRSRRGER
jgi:GTP cyclohydrolase I